MSWLFDSTSDYLVINSAPSDSTPWPLTVCMWIKASDFDGSSEQFLWQVGNGTSSDDTYGGLLDNVATNLPVMLRSRDTTNAATASNQTISDSGTWYHVAFRAESDGTTTAYVDGVASGTSSMKTMGVAPDKFMLGISVNLTGTNRFVSGRIAHVSVHESDLGTTAITALAGGANPLDYPTSLWAYWPMNTSEAAPTDSSGNARTLTVNNATYDADNPTVDSGVVTYLKLLAHPSAIGASSVEGVVLNAARDTVIGEFTGQTFIDGDGESPQVNPGYAVLKVAATDISPDGSTLTTSDTPLAIAYNATYSTPLVACTVIEE